MNKQLEHLNNIISDATKTLKQKLSWLHDNLEILNTAYKYGEITLEEKRALGSVTFNYIELVSAWEELDNA